MESNVNNNVDQVTGNVDMGRDKGGSPEDQIDYKSLYEKAASDLEEITAERNSLKTENDDLRTAHADLVTDHIKTKELNYTLSRQLNLRQEIKKEPEAILADMFLKKGE